MIPVLDRPLVTEFAQLALDVYEDKGDNNLRETEFNPLWRKIDQWPREGDWTRNTRTISTINPRQDVGLNSHQHTIKTDYDQNTGFYSAFYENFMTKVCVIAIRGTDSFLDVIADYDYVMNKVTKQYEEAKEFVFLMRDYYLESGPKKIYVCGHSLGGIVAKMIAPLTGFDTIAFNSPGVREYLQHRHLPSHYFGNDRDRNDPQQIITYCAKADPIGNLRHDNDIGHYRFVDVKGGEQIPENDDRLKSSEFIKDSFYDSKNLFLLTKYHKMIDMYEALKNSECQYDRI